MNILFRKQINNLIIKLCKKKFIWTIHFNYQWTLIRVKCKIKKNKLKVVFYTNEPQKWSYDSLYWEFENSNYFEPLIVVVPRYRVHKGLDRTRMSLEEQYKFYLERGYRVTYGYKEGKYIDIKLLKPDIFFYLQLAEIPGVDDPYIVSKTALTAYCPYAYQLSDYKKHYLETFHRLLYVNYMEHQLTLERFESYKKGNSKNCVSVGYPKLDVYLNTLTQNPKRYWKDPSKYKIIYAPHHSFRKNDSYLFRWSTFPENYNLILQIAREHLETTWIFKPHPMLKSTIIREGLMTEEQVNRYYAEWEEVGHIYDSGDYFDIFKTSDLMITDCGSFLAEYLPSNKPLIRLINKRGVPLNKLGKQFSDCYYNAYNNDDLLLFFDEIVVKGNDYKKAYRCYKAELLVDAKETAAHKIYMDLLDRII